MVIAPLEMLVEEEEKLREVVFSQETSSLNQLNQDFSPFNDKDFRKWLEALNNEGLGRILEIGGGIEQIAAQEILDQFSQLDFWEIELRPPQEEIKCKLEQTDHYHLLIMGFSQALSQVQILKQKFSLIFAHNVLNHLPNPFFVIENCYRLLKDGGFIFVNGVLIYEEEWEKIVNFLQEQGYQFSFMKKETPSNLKKKGIISISLTLLKNKRDFRFPLAQGKKLTDYQGQPLGPFEYFFDPGN